MKPKPFSALNHFTVPCATCAPTIVRADDPSESGDRVTRSSARRTRTWNSNRARTYPTQRVQSATPRTGHTDTDDLGDEACRAHRLQGRLHPVGGAHDRRQRVQGLESLAGVEDDGLLRSVEPPVGHQLPQHRYGDPAGGLGEDACRPGQVADALDDFLVA